MNELELLARALGFIFVIGLGYTLKVKGIVRREDARIFSSLVMNVTLPASLLVASATTQVSIDLYLPFILGILCNLFGYGRILGSKEVWSTDFRRSYAVIRL